MSRIKPVSIAIARSKSFAGLLPTGYRSRKSSKLRPAVDVTSGPALPSMTGCNVDRFARPSPTFEVLFKGAEASADGRVGTAGEEPSVIRRVSRASCLVDINGVAVLREARPLEVTRAGPESRLGDAVSCDLEVLRVIGAIVEADEVFYLEI